MTMSESTPCGNCDTPVALERRQDFFGYCSYACLQAKKEEFESGQADGFREPERRVIGGVFGPRSLF